MKQLRSFLRGFATSVCVAAVCLCSLEARAQALGTSSFQVAAIELSPKTRLVYEAYSVEALYRPPVREDFSVVILERWHEGLSFEYETTVSQLGKQKGTEALSSLDDCTSLDPWWDPAQIGQDSRCQLMVPRFVYRALQAEGKSWLAVDTVARQDTVVRWNVISKVPYACRVDGRMVLFNALEIQTSRGDQILLLDEPQAPLVLSIESTWFSWRLQAVETVNPI